MTSEIRLQIDLREPFAAGAPFGDTGPYERIVGKAHFAIDPDAPENRQIVDLELAPRNADGYVEYTTDIYILRPMNLARSNGRLMYDVNNRGNKRLLQFLNDAKHSNNPSAIEHAGNGYLMRCGYTIVWSGWQGDLLAGDGRLTMDLPVPIRDGQPVAGVTRCEFVANEPGIRTIPLSANDYTRSYLAASLDQSGARLTMREYQQDSRIEIAASEWMFATTRPDGEPAPSTGHLYYPAAFRPGWIYELVYNAINPRIMGLGFTGVRDLISFLLHQEADNAGQPNPLRDKDSGIELAYAWGRSQSGRFLRDFVYQGFNEDASGRQVFAGISPHVSGAGRVFLNYRFAQPGRFPRQHNDHLYPSDQFPFAYHKTTDNLTGNTDGILKRPDTDPVVIHTQTSSEYWDRRGSLVHTDTDGNDLPEHRRARVYLFAGSQHNADPLLGSPETYVESRSTGDVPDGQPAYPTNPLNTSGLLRAVIDLLDAWVTDGTPPPSSRVPRREDGSAASAATAQQAFPAIPGARHPNELCRLHVQDFGNQFERGVISIEPPEVDLSREYPVYVPAIDADGNEIPGIRTPHVSIPLATYTGWNFRPDGSSGDALMGTVGSYFRLPGTIDERLASRILAPRSLSVMRTTMITSG